MTTTKDIEIKATKWMSPSLAPSKIREWSGNQMVQLVATNEAMEKWIRFDGETRVVRA